MLSLIEEYKSKVFNLIERIYSEEWENLLSASKIMADCVKENNLIYAFGAGHSMALALDIFYRAGGFPQVYPMLDISASAYNGATKSTEIEKLPGYAKVLVNYYGLKEGDALIIISNSGNRVLPVEAGIEAKKRGVRVIAITSKEYSKYLPVENPYGRKLYEVADVSIDNKMPPGDAVINVEGLSTKIAPVSTIVNSFILQSLVIATVDNLIKDGFKPKIWTSTHIPGGEEKNREILEEYFKRIKPL
ncbi:MAG: SIS domain-containing protein [Candidatus Bathyarchaeota archaeon]|nr:SIS domain-containing protein [Candidatus Bathyarchaeota archaeon]